MQIIIKLHFDKEYLQDNAHSINLIVFPEFDYDKVNLISGLCITLVTCAMIDAHCRALLDTFNFPFKKK